MTVEVLTGIGVALFAIVSFFLVRVLITLDRTLRHIDAKVESLHSSFQALSHLGDVCEDETGRLKQKYLEPPSRGLKEDRTVELTADWLRASIQLVTQFLTRR